MLGREIRRAQSGFRHDFTNCHDSKMDDPLFLRPDNRLEAVLCPPQQASVKVILLPATYRGINEKFLPHTLGLLRSPLYLFVDCECIVLYLDTDEFTSRLQRGL